MILDEKDPDEKTVIAWVAVAVGVSFVVMMVVLVVVLVILAGGL